jgi:hypothetical protein
MPSADALQLVSALSAQLAEAERADDAYALAAIVAACRVVEARALQSLAGRATAADLLSAQLGAVAELGW